MRIGIMVVAVAAATIGVVTPAGAAPGDARWACSVDSDTGWTMISSTSFTVDGRTATQQVGVHDLQPGDILRITATGSVHNGTIVGQWRGPNGSLNDPAPDSWWLAPGLNKFSLYGRWGRNGFTFPAGADSGCITYSQTVGNGSDTVYVGVNDDLLEDNSGSFQVRARVYRNPNELRDNGFESQSTGTISAPWVGEGSGFKGIDVARNLQHGGRNNAFIRTTTGWNSIKQTIAVRPHTPYRMQVWVRTSNNFHDGYFGVRHGTSASVLADQQYGGFDLAGYRLKTLDFNSRENTSVSAFIGYWAPGYDSWIQVDDVAVWPLV